MASPATASASRHWLASVPSLMIKRLPMMIVSAAITWVIHTYLMAVLNEGSSGSAGWVGSLLNTSGVALLTTPAAMFVWAMLSAYAWNFLFLLRPLGPAGAFKRLADPILGTFRNVPGLAQPERGAWCVGAGAAVAVAQLMPITPGANIGLGCLWANIGLSQPGQWAVSRVTNMMPGVLTQAGAGSIAVSARVAQTLVLAFAPGLIVSSILPGGLGWLAAAALLVLGYVWFTGRGQASPGAGVKAFLCCVGFGALIYGVLNAMDLLLPLTLYADDGGWAESGCTSLNVACWAASSGAVPVMVAGVAPSLGASLGPLIPLGGDPGPGGGPQTEEPQTPDQEKAWIDRWNAVDPNKLLGNPDLQDEYRNIMDRFRATGRIDQKALDDFERKLGQTDDEKRKNWDKETRASVDRSNTLMGERDAARDADEQRQRDLEKKLQDTLKRVASGDLNSSGGLDIANNPQVYNPDGSINQEKLDDFINKVKGAKRDLAEQQRDNAKAVADTSGRVSDAWTAAEWAAKQARDRSANAVGAILTGGVGAAAGGGLLGAAAAGTAGTYFGAATGAIKAASDAGSLDKDVLLAGAAGGARSGAIGGVIGGVIGGAAGALPTNAITTAIANNPTVTGGVLGGVGAAITGGNVIEGVVDGAIGGKLGSAAGRTLGKPGGGWKKPIDWTTGPLPGQAPPADDPWGEGATPPPPGGPNSGKGPRVGLSEPDESWVKPPERGGGPKPEPTKVKGQDIDPPPDSQQPWKKRWGTDPETGKQTDAGIPPGVDPDGEPYFPDKVTGNKNGPPKDYEGPGATPGEKYPGGRGRDDGSLEPYTTPEQKATAAASREAEVARLAKEDPHDLAKRLTDAEMLSQDKKQADLLRDAMKRQRGDSKPPEPPPTPEDPAIRQAEVEKLQSLSRKELEARELIARIEGDKKQAELLREALNRNKEPSPPPVSPDRAKVVKDLSNLDLEDLAAARDAARARGNNAQADIYDDALKQQAADLKSQARAPRPQSSVEDLAKKYSLEELKQREQLFRNDGDEAGAAKMAEAAKRKSSYGAEEDARLEAVMEQRRRANDAARAAKAAEANLTPAEREAQAAALADQERARRAAEGQNRKAELDRLMEQMKAAQSKSPTPPVDQDAATNPNLPRPGRSRPPSPPAEPDLSAKTDPNLSRPDTSRPSPPPDAGDSGAKTDPNLSRPSTERPTAENPNEADFGAKTDPNLSRPGTERPATGNPPSPPPSAGDYDGLSPDHLKAMQEMARSSGNPAEAEAIGKALEKQGVRPEPERPDVRMPWEESGQTPRPDTPEPPPRTEVPEPPSGLKPEDLPPRGEPFTAEQRGNLRTDYTKDQLVAARNLARAEGNHVQANAIEDVLADRGYRAPVDPRDVAPPPPGQLPDYTQVENLAKNYSTKQLQELWADAFARGDKTLGLTLENAINLKKAL